MCFLPIKPDVDNILEESLVILYYEMRGLVLNALMLQEWKK